MNNSPMITVVTGTFNRFDLLKRFILSVRSQMPRTIPYSFIIADAGSTDGTLEWLTGQADVHLIKEGKRRGAIKAFTDAAKLSRAPYTLIANDDIELVKGSILRALVHLENHARCGGVAFAHNLPMRGLQPAFEGYNVAIMPAVGPDGARRTVVYAQVGMFRTEVGHEAGWWGGNDPVMTSGGGTYGADNYLSARIWEMGYTIDVVPGVANRDYAHMDALRSDNVAKEQQIGFSPYHRRFPSGPKLPAIGAADSPSERLRVLYLPLNERGHPILARTKRGFREALQRKFLVVEHDYLNDMSNRLYDIVSMFQPDLLFMQCHDAATIRPVDLAYARNAAPRMAVVNWNGDVWAEGLTTPAVLALLEHVDIQLTVNASSLPEYERLGIPAAYWQWAFETVDPPLPKVKAHDVLFLGNAYSAERRALVEALRTVTPKAGVYGRGYTRADGNTLYDYATGAALYRACKIAIADNQFPNMRGFFSNRLFEAAANGAFLMHQYVDGMQDLIGLREGVHYVGWQDFDDLKTKLAYWLDPAHNEARRAIADCGEQFIREHHSFDVRVRQLFDIIREKRGQVEKRSKTYA